MPTAARLIAALAFAVVAWFAAEAVKPYMTEGTQFGLFSQLSAAIGAVCGWKVMGGLVGHGYVGAAGYGVRVSATIVFWALLLFSTYEMVIEATKKRYDGPMEALTSIFAIALDYGRALLNVDVAGILLVGGMIAGVLAEWGSRRWK